MQNIIHRKYGRLVPQAQEANAGLAANGAALGLVQVTDASMTLHITDLIVAHGAVTAGKVVLKEKADAMKGLVTVGKEHVGTARDVLKVYLGKNPSAAFTAAGYEGSLAIPQTRQELAVALLGLKKYFTDHPDHENAGLNVSAARATTLSTDLGNAVAAWNQQRGVVSALCKTKNTKLEIVRADVRGVLADLGLKADPTGDVWPKFGFFRPGILSIPDVPLNVAAILIGPSAAALKWDKAARASNYRIYKKVVGVDEDWVYVDTRNDLDFTIEGLPAGATIEIAVSASNNGGESAKSAITAVVTVAA